MRLAELFLRLTLALDLTAATAVLSLATSDPSACSLRRSCNLFWRPYAQVRTVRHPADDRRLGIAVTPARRGV